MKNSSSPNDRKYQRLREQVAEWLSLEGFDVSTVDTSEPVFWAIAAILGGMGLGISQSVARPQKIGFSGIMDIANWQTAKLNQLSTEERNDFNWDLRLRLLALDLDYSFDDPLRSVTISREIFSDNPTRSTVVATARAVRAGLLTAVACIMRRSGVPPEGEATN